MSYIKVSSVEKISLRFLKKWFLFRGFLLYLVPHLYQVTRQNLSQFFLHIDLKIRNNLISSWKESGQQTAINHKSGTPTLSEEKSSCEEPQTP